MTIREAHESWARENVITICRQQFHIANQRNRRFIDMEDVTWWTCFLFRVVAYQAVSAIK